MTATDTPAKSFAERHYEAALDEYHRATYDDHIRNWQCLSQMCQALAGQIAELRAQLAEPILGATTVEAVKTEPTVRVRLQHTHTLKEGWRLSESTVEWSGAGTPDWESIAGQLRATAVYGRTEAEDRNHPLSPREEGGAE